MTTDDDETFDAGRDRLLAEAWAERDKLREEVEGLKRSLKYSVELLAAHNKRLSDEVDRLRAGLTETPETVEARAQDLFRAYHLTPTKEDPNPDPAPTWQEVVDEDSADDWRAMARFDLAALRAKAGIP